MTIASIASKLIITEKNTIIVVITVPYSLKSNSVLCMGSVIFSSHYYFSNNFLSLNNAFECICDILDVDKFIISPISVSVNSS